MLVAAGFDLVGWDGHSSDTGIEDGGIEVGPVWPIDGAKIRVDSEFPETIEILQRSKHTFKLHHRCKIKLTHDAIFKAQTNVIAF